MSGQPHTADIDSTHCSSDNSYEGPFTYTNSTQAPTYYGEPESYSEPKKAGVEVTEKPLMNGR